LSITDPSGYFFGKLFRSIGKFFKKYWKPILAIAIAAVIVVTLGSGSALLGITGLGWNPIAVGAIAGAAAGGITGGAKGALFGAISGAAFAGVGQIYGMESVQAALGEFVEVARAMSHGVVAGSMQAAQGGNFLTGFATGSISSFATHTVFEMGSGFHAEELVAAAVVGGTVSEVSGGDFANGAVTGSFQYLFNAKNRN
jgi:hypothetical protein